MPGRLVARQRAGEAWRREAASGRATSARERDALEPLFGLGRLQSLVLVTCPNVGDALLEDLDELSEDRWLPLRRLELAGTRCTAAKVAEVEAALAGRSTTVDIALRDSVVVVAPDN